MESPDQFSATPAGTLYCAEDAGSWDDDTAGELDCEWDQLFAGVTPASVEELLAAEVEYLPRDDYLARYLSRDLNATARQDAVSWILKVNEMYRFRQITAYLAVSYLDRFLSNNTVNAFQVEDVNSNGTISSSGVRWPMQLLSVACISVAAKMEETQVPLLLDLQVVQPGYVFESRIVQRMELFLMSALNWRMRSTTPLDFLDSLSASLPLHLRRPFFSQAADLIFKTHRGVEFLAFKPSEIATAAAEICSTVEMEGGYLSSATKDLINKEPVARCRQLMIDYLIDACPFAACVKLSLLSDQRPPPSPVGVLEANPCSSCETHQKSIADGELSQGSRSRSSGADSFVQRA